MVRIADFESARVGSSPTASATWEPLLVGAETVRVGKKVVNLGFDSPLPEILKNPKFESF